METPEKQVPTSIFQSTTARMIMVGFLSLFLLIPLEFVKNLINERSLRKQEVISEVANLWGKNVQFYGPMLKIPYKTIIETHVEDAKTKKITIQRKLSYDFVYFFPETLNNKSKVVIKLSHLYRDKQSWHRNLKN